MQEIVELFPIPVMRMRGALQPQLVESLVAHFSGLASLNNYITPMQKTADNGYRGQHTGYSNLEYDALVDRYQTTIPRPERMQAAAAAIHHMTDQLVVMTTFYNTQPQAVANRLKNVPKNASVANIYAFDLN